MDSEWIHKPRDEFDYGLKYEEPDEDGIQLAETNNGKTVGKIYIYNSEIKKIIKKLEEKINGKNMQRL